MGAYRGGIGRCATQYEEDATAAQHDAGAATDALGRGSTHWREELCEEEEEEEEEGGSKESIDLSYFSNSLEQCIYFPDNWR